MTLDRKVAVIDLDSVAYSIGNGVKLLDNQGNPLREDGKRFVYRDKTEIELIESTDFYMNQILGGGGFTHYVGFMKGQDTTVRRKTINPEYKANRSDVPPKWWDFVLNQLFLRWQCKYVHEMEVDDAVNIIRHLLPDSHIVAIDGDLLGLEGTHYRWRPNPEWITITKEQAERKFWSDMVCGQVGDNIKGIPGKGPAFFNKLLERQGIIHELVLREYTLHFGMYYGIEEFYKNYMSLKILDESPGYIVPEPIEYKNKAEKDISQLFNKET